MKGNISEIFYSLQGEGVYAGVLQVFLRLAGCSLSCVYCDSVGSRAAQAAFRVLRPSGEETHENPFEAAEAAALVRGVIEELEGVHSVSVTGGEPLEQPEFLEALLDGLSPGRHSGNLIYLETNGLFVDAARRVSSLVDIVALDIKLPSLCGEKDAFDIYDRVIPIFAGRRLFYKIVLIEGFDETEFDEALRVLAAHDDTIPLVIQPATIEGPMLGISQGKLFDLYGKASRFMKDVRVLPQIHRFIGLQ